MCGECWFIPIKNSSKLPKASINVMRYYFPVGDNRITGHTLLYCNKNCVELENYLFSCSQIAFSASLISHRRGWPNSNLLNIFPCGEKYSYVFF